MYTGRSNLSFWLLFRHTHKVGDTEMMDFWQAKGYLVHVPHGLIIWVVNLLISTDIVLGLYKSCNVVWNSHGNALMFHDFDIPVAMLHSHDDIDFLVINVSIIVMWWDCLLSATLSFSHQQNTCYRRTCLQRPLQQVTTCYVWTVFQCPNHFSTVMRQMSGHSAKVKVHIPVFSLQ